MANKTNTNLKETSKKANTNAVATIAMNTTADALFAKLLNKAEYAKALSDKKTCEKVECDGKVGFMMTSTRKYFVDAYEKAEKLSTSADWTSRMIIAATLESDVYKDSFLNDADFANQIGQSKAFISKARYAVEIRQWLIDNKYGADWKPSTVEELITPYKDFKKKSLDFKEFMKVTGLTSKATVKQVRDARKVYDVSLVTVKTSENTTSTPVTSTSITSGQDTPVTSASGQDTPVTSTSIASGQGRIVGDVDAMSAHDVKTKLGFDNMTIVINFNGVAPIEIKLTDADNRTLANSVLTVLTGKIKEQLKK